MNTAGRGAALRVAWRTSRYNRKRTIFVILLIAVPVAVAVVAAGFLHAEETTPEESVVGYMGAADMAVPHDGSAITTSWLEAAVDQLDGGADATTYRTVNRTFGTNVGGPVTDLDLQSPLVEGMWDLTEGSIPASTGEVVLSDSLARFYRAGVGDSVRLDPNDPNADTYRVVGLAKHGLYWNFPAAFVSPDALDLVEAPVGEREAVTLIATTGNPDDVATTLQEAWNQSRFERWPEGAVVPKPVILDELVSDDYYVLLNADQVGQLIEVAQSDPDAVWSRLEEMLADVENVPTLPWLGVESRSAYLSTGGGGALETPFALATLVSAVLLAEVAFIAGASFAAGVRRRLREIGLMGCNGATESHMRWSLIGEGIAAGLIGGLVGVGLGALFVIFGRPLIQQFVGRRITGLLFTPTDAIGPLVMAVLAAALAAWVPARTAARVQVTTALQGRMPTSAPRRWTVPVGVGAAGLGTLLLLVGLATESTLGASSAALGVACMIGGSALLAGPLIAFTSRLASRTRSTLRLVLRDSSRHRTRAAAAVAATLVIMVLPAAGLTADATSRARTEPRGLRAPATHLILLGTQAGPFGQPQLRDEDIALVRRQLPEAAYARFDQIDVPGYFEAQMRACQAEAPDVDIAQCPLIDEGGIAYSVAHANPDLIAVLDDPRIKSALDQQGVVVLGLEDRSTKVMIAGISHDARELPIPAIEYFMPRILVNDEIASALDGPVHQRALFIAPETPTTEQMQPLWNGNLDMTTGWEDTSSEAIVALAIGGTILIVLIVVALVTALSAAESGDDIQAMVAVGAANSIRRRFFAIQAGYHTVIAAVLAIPLGILMMKALASTEAYRYAAPFGVVDGTRIAIPWLGLGLLLVVVPITMTLLTALAVRSAPLTPPRRAG
ncbi:MAG: FtsX-like permease family protein [Acidimicrobiia bacterium]